MTTTFWLLMLGGILALALVEAYLLVGWKARVAATALVSLALASLAASEGFAVAKPIGAIAANNQNTRWLVYLSEDLHHLLKNDSLDMAEIASMMLAILDALPEDLRVPRNMGTSIRIDLSQYGDGSDVDAPDHWHARLEIGIRGSPTSEVERETYKTTGFILVVVATLTWLEYRMRDRRTRAYWVTGVLALCVLLAFSHGVSWGSAVGEYEQKSAHAAAIQPIMDAMKARVESGIDQDTVDDFLDLFEHIPGVIRDPGKAASLLDSVNAVRKQAAAEEEP